MEVRRYVAPRDQLSALQDLLELQWRAFAAADLVAAEPPLWLHPAEGDPAEVLEIFRWREADGPARADAVSGLVRVREAIEALCERVTADPYVVQPSLHAPPEEAPKP